MSMANISFDDFKKAVEGLSSGEVLTFSSDPNFLDDDTVLNIFNCANSFGEKIMKIVVVFGIKSPILEHILSRKIRHYECESDGGFSKAFVEIVDELKTFVCDNPMESYGVESIHIIVL